MNRLRCAVATLPAEAGDPERLRRSVEAARVHGSGDFADFVPVVAEGRNEALLAEAARAAQAQACDWLLAVSAAEALLPDFFVKTAPALRLHDVVWGGASLDPPASGPVKPERITRLAAQDLPTFFHAALAWWIGPTHLVRPAAALEALEGASGPAWRAVYMDALWRGARAYKTAQALTVSHGPLPLLSQSERAHLVDDLERRPVFMPVAHGASTLRLPYTGVNPIIEREQARGLFFEPEELGYLAERLGRGLRIVDAGANTGNHTVFFASVMAAEIVIPIEPHPRAAAALRTAVAENGLPNVDLSCLGHAVGAGAGRLTALHSPGGGLGATRFVPAAGGDTPVSPLDELIRGRVDFIKIDVEGMEMAVLAGARSLMRRSRPAIFIEVLDATIPEFMAWVDSNGYTVEKLFPDKTHCNYLLLPVEGSRKVQV